MVGSLDIDGLGGQKKSDLGEEYDWDFSTMIRRWDRSGDTPRELSDLDGWGSRTADSVWDQFREKMDGLTWDEFYDILCLDEFGEKTREKYLRANREDPYPPTESKLLATPSVQEKTSEKVLDSFDRDIAETLLECAYGVRELGIFLEEDQSDELSGIQVFVTGTLNNWVNRGEFKEFVREHGAEWGKSEDAILVTNDPSSGSSKAQYARENNLEILTESEFLNEFGLEVV